MTAYQPTEAEDALLEDQRLSAPMRAVARALSGHVVEHVPLKARKRRQRRRKTKTTGTPGPSAAGLGSWLGSRS